MGLSLRLLPIDHLHGAMGFSHTVIPLGGVSWDFAPTIQALATAIPKGHDISAHEAVVIKEGAATGERRHGPLTTDSYGEPYTWIQSRHLLPILLEHWPKHPATAYVRALSPGHLIVLDWH